MVGQRRIRRRVGEHPEQQHASRAVDGGVVGLGQHRPSPIGESLDDVGLPQWPCAIHPATDDAGNLLGKLIGTSRRSQPDVANVIVEVEIRVVDPVRVIEFERHLHQTAAHRFEPSQQRIEPLVRGLVGIEITLGSLVDR
jgi:hypothetical protein